MTPVGAGKRAWLAGGLAVLVVAAAGTTLALTRFRDGAMVPDAGDELNRAIPNLPLTGADGKPTSLAAFRGKVIVLSPFLTLCSEVCPITAGAYLEMRRSLRAAGLGDRVAFVEVTVDSRRDTPSRLRAFARLTGIDWAMLTGTEPQVHAFWSFFGVGYYRTPQGDPPAPDWLTHRPQGYDVAHTDALFFIDPASRERVVLPGAPALTTGLPPSLAKLLSAEGRNELGHPHGPWTVRQALTNLGALLGRRLPQP
jgi:protein SCO1/2